jgi:hypothetical protein
MSRIVIVILIYHHTHRHKATELMMPTNERFSNPDSNEVLNCL